MMDKFEEGDRVVSCVPGSSVSYAGLADYIGAVQSVDNCGQVTVRWDGGDTTAVPAGYLCREEGYTRAHDARG